ncbi:hypothetical protein ScPMuIL_014824 [Solemya velum]
MAYHRHLIGFINSATDSTMDRVVALVDMDCFYVQVEQRENPEMKGKPCAVVQYRTYKGGGIIAIAYEARARGVTRGMMGDDAKKQCPDIHLFRVQETRGKANLTKYREAGAEVIAVLSKFSQCVERASIDEAYIDLTEEVATRMKTSPQREVDIGKLANTFIIGHDDVKDDINEEEARRDGLQTWLDVCQEGCDFSLNDSRLAVGAVIVEEIRAAVYEQTGFRCSAGIAHNKVLAKLSCGIHKPNKQTVLPHASVGKLFETLPVRKIRSLGGKRGQVLLDQLNVQVMADLLKFTRRELQNQIGDKPGAWLYDMCRGVDTEEVRPRQIAKSIGCSKTFNGKLCLDTKDKVLHWLSQLTDELIERLLEDRNKNKRVAKTLTLTIQYAGNPPVSASRTCAIPKYDGKKITDDCFTLLQKFNTLSPHQEAWAPAILILGMYASKFTMETIGPGLSTFFKSTDKDKFSNVASTAEILTQDLQSTPSKMNSIKSKRSIATFFQRGQSGSSNDRTDGSCNSDVSAITNDAGKVSVRDGKQTNSCKTGLKGFFAAKEESFQISNPDNCSASSKNQSLLLLNNISPTDSCNSFSEFETVKNEFSESKHTKQETCIKTTDGSKNECFLDSLTCDNSSFDSESDCIGKEPITNVKGIERFFASKLRSKNQSEGCPFKDGNTDTSNSEGDVVQTVNDISSTDSCSSISRSKLDTCQLVINRTSDSVSNVSNINEISSQKKVNFFSSLGAKNLNVDVEENKSFQDSVSDNKAFPVESHSDPNVSACTYDELVKCEKCAELVSPWTMPEHLDFHYAKELEITMNASLPIGGIGGHEE